MTLVSRVRLERVDHRLEAALPPGLAERYGLRPGDEMLALDVDDGIWLAPRGSPFYEAYRAYEEMSRRYCDVIEQLVRQPVTPRRPSPVGNHGRSWASALPTARRDGGPRGPSGER